MLTMIRTLCLAAVAVTIAVTAPAHAQSRRELAERIDATEVRIGELESQFMAGDPVAERLLERMDALEFQVRELTSESERLNFENRRLREQIESLEMELEASRTPRIQPVADAFMSEGVDGVTDGTRVDGAVMDGSAVAVVDPDDPFAAERAAATGVLGGGASTLPAAEPADPGVIYADARSRLLDGDFDGAQLGFEQFVNEHAEDPRAGEAWYWLGETFFVRSNFGDAASAYITSLRTQPEGEKAPDAMVRLAASLHGLGQTQDACDTLARFGRQFPNASAASRDRAARESVRANCR